MHILSHDTFLPPLGALPKGGHGGEDHNTRTQVTFAVFEEFIHSFHRGLTPFFFSPLISCNEHSRRTICFTCWLAMCCKGVLTPLDTEDGCFT